MLILISFSISKIITDFKAYFNNYYNVKRTFNLAEKYYNEGKINMAIENYRKIEGKASKIIKLHSNSSFVDDALYMLAISYSRLGEYTKSEQKFRELFQFFPNSKIIKNAKLEYGIMLYNANKLDDALNYLSQIKDKKARSYLMKTYYKLGNYERAKLLGDELLKLKEFEKDNDFKIVLANVYIRTNDLEKAEALIEEISKIQTIPDTTRNNLIFLLSDAYLNNKNYDKALSSINKITYNDSTSLAFFVKLKTAKIYIAKGDTTKAMDIFEYLSNFAFDSTKYLSYYYLGTIFENREDFEKALDFYDKAYAGGIKFANERKEVILKLKSVKDESDLNKLYRLAEIFFLDLNKPDLALETLDKIIEQSRDDELNQKALLFAVYLCSKYLNNKEKAIDYYSKIKQKWMLDIARTWIE